MRAFLFSLVVQISVSLAFSLMPVLIAQRLNPAAVADYSVAQRVQMIVLVPWQLLLTPLWPAFGEALAARDVGWIRRTLWRAVFWGAVYGGAAGLFIIFLGGYLVEAWTGHAVQLSRFALVSLGMWVAVSAANIPLWNLVNASGRLGGQALFAIAFGLMAAGLAWTLLPRCGIAGAIVATVVSYLVCVQSANLVIVGRVMRVKD